MAYAPEVMTWDRAHAVLGYDSSRRVAYPILFS
jgi:hypothetical protein